MKYLQTFFFPELSSHIDEEFMADQAHLKGLAHGTTSQFKINIQLWTYDKFPEISVIPLLLGMTDITEVPTARFLDGNPPVLGSHRPANLIRHNI